MVDLFKLLMSKPLEAIVATLCIVIVTMQLGIFEVREAQAVLISQQSYNDIANAKVFAMSETLIRIDTNVLNMKEQQDKWNLNNKWNLSFNGPAKHTQQLASLEPKEK